MDRSSSFRTRLAAFGLLLIGCAGEPEADFQGSVTADSVSLALAGRGDPLLVQLGRAIFFDANLSANRNQSCAACHGAEWGFTGPDTLVNAGSGVYPGSIAGRFGDRKPTASAYATQSPVLRREGGGADAGWSGGNFWDGRATGEKLGSPAADQAQGPFLNPAEQALPDAACVVYRVANGSYADLYTRVWGGDVRTIAFPADTDERCGREVVTIALSQHDRARVETEFGHVALAIAAFEASSEVDAFSSKLDAVREGRATFSPEEERGRALFEGKAKCNACHASGGDRPLFTDFSYDNTGVPRNPENPVYAENPAFVDVGLGKTVDDPVQDGKFKVPTLRNVDRRPRPDAVKAYMHNGVFKSLEQVVHFYNTRDVLPPCGPSAGAEVGVRCWPAPEVGRNLNRRELGNLGLSAAEERDLVAFLKTLSDGYGSR